MRRDPTEGGPVGVIYNPAAGDGSGHAEALRDALGIRGPDLVVTRRPGDAREVARRWREGLLVVVGGDGTVNEAVDGLGQAGFPEGVTLAVLPAGTANDLAATLGVPDDPQEAEQTIRERRTRLLDVARVRCGEGSERFFMNVAIGGFGTGASRRASNGGLKERWGKLSYLRASLEAAREFDAVDTRLVVDGAKHRLRATNLVVGNCRYAGGGWPAAPRANPEDGLLDLVVVEELDLRGLLSLGSKTSVGADYLHNEGVFFARGRELRVESDPPGRLQFNVDGELIGTGPAGFDVLPRAVRFIVGPGYAPEATPQPGEPQDLECRPVAGGHSPGARSRREDASGRPTTTAGGPPYR